MRANERSGRAWMWEAIAVIGGGVLGACSSTALKPEPVNAAVGQAAGSPDLVQGFVMEGVSTKRRDGRLTVGFDLRDMESAAGTVEWAIIWLDEAGAPIPGARRWAPAIFNGEGVQAVSGVAPTASAKGFRLALRKP